MAQRVVGGGERFVARAVISLNAVQTASVLVPAGADAARIQMQLLANPTFEVLVARGADNPTLAANEAMIGDHEVLFDAFPAGETIRFRLVNDAGVDQVGGASDRIAVVFYTNVAGRAGKVAR